MNHENRSYLVYIGTYTHGASEGIYVYSFNTRDGTMEHLYTTRGINNPSFLAVHPTAQYIYAVEEIDSVSQTAAGMVHAYSIDNSSGELTNLNHQLSGGSLSCHLSIDQTGHYLLFANYGSGSVGMMPIKSDGSLGKISDFIQHKGSSVDVVRQQSPHPHSINVDPTNQYAFVPDLGLDEIISYKLDLDNGKLVVNNTASLRTKPGSGPRHFDFHPSGKYAYVINEIDSTLTGFEFDSSDGTLKHVNTTSTLPMEATGVSHCADVHTHPSGQFVYGSNRGHDSISIFKSNTQTGRLEFIGTESTKGKIPRNFAIDPTGSYLLAANQDSDSVVIFRINLETGMLDATGHVTDVPSPVCLKFIPTR